MGKEIPPINDVVRRRIEDSLAGIERDEGITILFAAESGSRAWGFPSPDSDYDVRFVYVRPVDWYLSLGPKRDVIEYPIRDELDISGWDIQKALPLMLAGNPSLMEWMRSPIVYRENWQMAHVRQLAGKTRHREAACHHYRSLAEKQMKDFVRGKKRVRLKKYLYCIRPAAALAWLQTHSHGEVPMDLPSLLRGITLPPAVAGEIEQLLKAKSAISEAGERDPIPSIDAWVDSEIDLARQNGFPSIRKAVQR